MTFQPTQDKPDKNPDLCDGVESAVPTTERAELVYTTVFALESVKPLDADHVLLNADGIEMVITQDPEPYCEYVDVSRWYLGFTMGMLFGKVTHDNHEEFTTNERNRLRALRQTHPGTARLVIRVSDWVEFNPENLEDFAGVLGCDHRVEPPVPHAESLRLEKLADMLLGVASSSLTVSLAYPLARGRYALWNDRPVYWGKMSGRGRTTVTKVQTPTMLDFAKASAQASLPHLHPVPTGRISTPAHLLSMSLRPELDPLARFLTAWNGLEILVTKTFSEAFKLRTNDRAKIPLLDATRRPIEKYTLVDKFEATGQALGTSDARSELDTFKKIKRNRDSVMHGRDLDFEMLPSDQCRELLGKYIQLTALSSFPH